MDERITQLRKGALDLAVLALIDAAPCYGGQIVEQLQGAGLDVSTGTIYPVLTRLKKAELVTTEWQESPYGPPRKYYSPSEAGRTELAELAQAWRELNASLGSLLSEAPHALHQTGSPR